MDVTIVIPTKNGGELLDRVLAAVFSQKTQYTYEVICVDSGSKDNTLDIIRKYDCKLYQIPPSEFGHGKTRNYGAFKGTGTYIIFLTQDALPAAETWLQNFIDAMKLDSDIVGGFGIHYPYEDCNIFEKRDLDGHFKGFGLDNTIYFLEDPKRYKEEEAYRHKLAFFSDNNSCVRRDIFEKYPYEDVNFAEDQLWAIKMILSGSINVAILTGVIGGLSRKTDFGILALCLYILVPFVISHGCYLLLLFWGRNMGKKWPQITAAVFMGLAAMIPGAFPGVYRQMYLPVWGGVFLMGVVLLGLELHSLFKKLSVGGEKICWS